ncbi:MAG: hypothetical protein QM737_22715 [Ferruginibacter sp.]
MNWEIEMKITIEDYYLDGMPANFDLKNFEKYYDHVMINRQDKPKGTTMKTPTKQDLKDEISRQKAVIDELLNTIAEKDKEFKFLHKLHISALERCTILNSTPEQKTSVTAESMLEKLKTGDFLPKDVRFTNSEPFKDLKDKIKQTVEAARKAKTEHGEHSIEYRNEVAKIAELKDRFEEYNDGIVRAFITDKDLQDHQDKQNFYNNLGSV